MVAVVVVVVGGCIFQVVLGPFFLLSSSCSSSSRPIYYSSSCCFFVVVSSIVQPHRRHQLHSKMTSFLLRVTLSLARPSFMMRSQRHLSVSVPLQLVKELRQRTGAPIVDCKKALSQDDVQGDMQLATDWLRKKGLAVYNSNLYL